MTYSKWGRTKIIIYLRKSAGRGKIFRNFPKRHKCVTNFVCCIFEIFVKGQPEGMDS